MPGAPLFDGLDPPLILIVTLKLVYCLRHLERKQTNKNTTKLDHENKGMFERKIEEFFERSIMKGDTAR